MNVLKSCDCIEQVNAKLAERNQRLELGLAIPASSLVGEPVDAIARLLLRTVKNGGGRSKPVAVSAAYCPFCGVKAAP